MKKCFEKTSSPETPGDSIESDQNEKSRLTEEFHHMAIEEDYVSMVDGESSSKLSRNNNNVTEPGKFLILLFFLGWEFWFHIFFFCFFFFYIWLYVTN